MRAWYAPLAVAMFSLAGCYPVYHVDTVVPSPDVALSESLLGVWVLSDTTETTTGFAAAVVEFADDSTLWLNMATDEGAGQYVARVGRLEEFTVLELWPTGEGYGDDTNLDPWPRPRYLGAFALRGDTLTIAFLDGDDLPPVLQELGVTQFLRRHSGGERFDSDELLLTGNTTELVALYPTLLRRVGLDPAAGVRYIRAARP